MKYIYISKQNRTYTMNWKINLLSMFLVQNLCPNTEISIGTGRIYLFNVQTGEIYVGLLDKIIKFCETHEYTYEFQDNKFYGLPFEENEEISREGVKDYVTAISRHTPKITKIDGVYDALKHNRKLLISPTASGKSLMIYAIVRYYVEQEQNILIVVPTTSLVEQMYKDFADYGWDVGSFYNLCW